MNIIIFIAGMGVGTFVSGLCFLWVLRLATKPSEKSSAHMKETGDLLRERNAHAAKMEKHLATLANWADNNWNLNRQ